MKRKLFAAGLGLVLLLSGCGGGGSSDFSGGADMEDMAASSAADDSWAGESWEMDVDLTNGNEMMYAPEAPAPAEEGGSSVYRDSGAKLIRRAELSIQTEQFDQSVKALEALTAQCDGYFENSSVYGGGRRDANAARNGEFVVRVPAEKYDQFLSSAGGLGYVTSKTESSQDVGEEYYDIEARLRTQRTKQERLLALLEKAETMEDIIALESALSDVEYQIEMYTSDLSRYDALIGFSTFRVYLSEVGRVTQEVGETASLGQRMSAGAQASFRGLVQGFQDFLVWASYNVFLLAVLAAVAVAAAVVGRRELKKRKARQDGQQDKEP